MPSEPVMQLRAITWNMNQNVAAWGAIPDGVDVVMAQESVVPGVARVVNVTPSRDGAWQTVGGRRPWCTSVAQVGNRVRTFAPVGTRRLAESGEGLLPVSLMGSIAAADIGLIDGTTVTLVSMYAAWDYHPAKTIWADGSAHRLASDLSYLARFRGHRIIAAGDLNILYGYGEGNERDPEFWAGRYRTVFDHFAAIGLDFVGPQHPLGRQAEPWPDELPRDSKNVPTYHTSQKSPATAERQLDFVFASRDLAPRLLVTARNALKDWGPSDHCRVEIELFDRAIVHHREEPSHETRT